MFLEKKCIELEEENAVLRKQCEAAEARAEAAERELERRKQDSGRSGDSELSESDKINAEVARVRQEIKQQKKQQKSLKISTSRIPTNTRLPSQDPDELLKGTRAADLMEDVAIEKLEKMWMTKTNKYAFGDWRLSKMPGRSFIAKVEGYHIESGDVVLDCLPSDMTFRLVEPTLNMRFYSKYIANTKHVNVVGLAGIGAFADIPIVISVEQVATVRGAKLRRKPVLGLIRAPGGTEQLCFTGYDVAVARLPYQATTFHEFLQQRFPNCKFVEVKGDAHGACMKSLLNFESMNIVETYKIGAMRWIDGQSENEAFANPLSDDFVSFMSWIADRIELKDFSGFRGGLNVREGNITGTHSYYTKIEQENIEIMFHVAGELPYSESDPQCLERKRHLGNDVVMVIFWEGDGEFDPSLVKSQFNHVFIVVSIDGSSIRELDKMRYRISVTSKSDVPRWEPFLPYPPVFDKSDVLRTWLLYKMINGERAAMHAPVFRTKLTKTNTSYLRSLVDQYNKEEKDVE